MPLALDAAIEDGLDAHDEMKNKIIQISNSIKDQINFNQKIDSENKIHRLQLGPFKNRKEANEAKLKIEKLGYTNSFIITRQEK